jgi:hypothetical protein
MGREIRRVPSWWQHPIDADGRYVPLFDRSYDEAVRDYEYELKLWEDGRYPAQHEYPGETTGLSYAGWSGEPPIPQIYRQQSWTEDEATHVRLYENISEGTPTSPIFSTIQELGAWMIEHGYTQEQVAKIIVLGSLPSGIICADQT